MINRRQLLSVIAGIPVLGCLFRGKQVESSTTCASISEISHCTPVCCDAWELPEVDWDKGIYNAEVIQSLPVECSNSVGGVWKDYRYVLVRLVNDKVRVAMCFSVGKYQLGQKLFLDTDNQHGLFVRGSWYPGVEGLKPAICTKVS